MLKKTYSVSELAIQLELPRTTINDWLKSFAPYLEYEMKGKRKEYNENALNVLKNISVWKNDGKSAAAIQKLLEENYGICGEVSAENTVAEPTAESRDTSNVSNGELMKVVHSDLEILLANVENLNTKRIKSARRAAWSSAFFMLIIFIAIGCGGYFLYLAMQRLDNNNNIAQKDYVTRISALQAENKKQMDELSRLRKLELDKISSDFDIHNKKFQELLAAQRAELTAELQKLAKTTAEQREKEIILMRENFAAERQKMLEKIVAGEKELSALKISIAKLQNNINAMTQLNQSLQKQNKDLSGELQKAISAKNELEKQCAALAKSLSELKISTTAGVSK